MQLQIVLITISIIITTSIYYNRRQTTRKHNKEPTTNYHSEQQRHTRTKQEAQPYITVSGVTIRVQGADRPG